MRNSTGKNASTFYDRATTFFFLDPPYTSCNPGVYGAWTTADVLRFRERLNNLKGRWLVTLNDAPDIRRIFSDCEIVAVERPRGITTVGSKTYRELVISPLASGGV